MNKFFGAIKGFIIGTANIIPGLSGGTLMVVFNVYERLIEAVNIFPKHPFKALLSIWDLILGMFLGLLLAFIFLSYTYEIFPLIFVLFFIGLVLGGAKTIIDKIKDKINIVNVIIFLISFIFIALLPLVNPFDGIYDGWLYYIILIFLGFIVAFSSLAPGISGSLILIILGYYTHILQMGKDIINNVVSLNFSNVVPFLGPLLILIISFLIGFYFTIKFIKKMLDKYETKFYFSALGMLFASPIAMLLMLNKDTPIKTFNYINWIIGLILLVIGFIGVFMVGYIESKKNKRSI